MVVSVIVLIIIGILLIISNRLERSILFPPFIFNAIWFLVLLVYIIIKIIDPGEMENLGPKTIWFIMFANISFTAGGLYLFDNLRRRDMKIKYTPTKVPSVIGDIVILITLITLVLLFLKARTLASEIEAQNFFIALRHQLTNLRKDYGLLEYFLVFGIFASLYKFMTFSSLRELSVAEKIKLFLSIVISFGFLILSTGRTYFFFYFITFFLIIYQKGAFRTKYFRMFLVLSLLLFITVGIVLSKGGSMYSSFSENIKSSLTHILAYLNGPVLAFNRFIESDFDHTYGKNTFRFFYAVVYRIGLTNEAPIDIVKEYVFVPYPTNVYTLFYTYVIDFGRAGTIILMFLFGLLNSWLFYKSRYSNNHVKLITAFSYYPLLMVFFQDQYFSLLSFWIQLWFYSFVLLRVVPAINRFKKGG